MAGLGTRFYGGACWVNEVVGGELSILQEYHECHLGYHQFPFLSEQPCPEDRGNR